MNGEFSCLAVETATAVSSIAACRGDRVGIRRYENARGGSENVYESVREALDEVGLKLEELDCIAFGCGPGGFTGLRVGAAVVQSLAFGVSVPVCRVSSLAVMAAGAIQRHGASLVATCLDARMGEAYVAVYAADDNEMISVRLEDRLVDPHEYEIVSPQKFLAAGPGWAAFTDLRERHEARFDGTDFDLLPSAEDLLPLARHYFSTGRTVAAAEAVPNYVRDKVTQ
jgi:tRNA threonylcarbamoyladenosine biosynthesis protein TsaB